MGWIALAVIYALEILVLLFPVFGIIFIGWIISKRKYRMFG
jgi:hypothetical protein